MNSFKKYFWDVIKNHYVDIKGVATRKQYWMFVLYKFLFIVPILLLAAIWGISSFIQNVNGYYNHDGIVLPILAGIFFVLFFIVLIGTILPSISISIRRLHDIGLSGWFLLLNLIPYLGSFIIFIFHLMPSKSEDNKYLNSNNKFLVNNIDVLEKLHLLKEKGIITEEEFNKKKEELLK